MGRRRIGSGVLVTLPARFEPDVKSRLIEVSSELNKTPSELIRLAVNKFLDSLESKKPAA